MLKPKLHHRRENGEIDTEFSSSCPKCAYHIIEKTVGTITDFDERGWYNVVNYSCSNPKCNHKWNERIYVSECGQTSYYHNRPLKTP